MAGEDFQLDTDGDLLWRDGDLVLGVNISQAIKIRLRTWKGEWFLNQDVGTEWRQTVFRKPFNSDHVERHLRARIRETDGVTALISYEQSLNVSTRVLTVSYRVQTDAGEISDDVEVFG